MSYIYQPTDIVLAKVKGYPSWPAMIIPEEIVPDNVLKGKSKTVMELENNNKKNSEDFIICSNQLKVRKYTSLNHQYCVKFFYDDSYIWLKPHDFKLLTIQMCQEWLNNNKRKPKKLIPAYEMALNGRDSIDVLEFVEYGSQGKPHDEDVEDDFSPDVDPKYDELSTLNSRTNMRKTQNKPNTRKKIIKDQKKPSRCTRSKKMNTELELSSKSKMKLEENEIKPSKQMNKQKIPKYHYDDDEDWSLLGLGPQDLTISSKPSLVNKLAQKKNLQTHNEMKLELQDKLVLINTLLLHLIVNKNKETTDLLDDYEILLTEFNLAMGIKSRHNELDTVFIYNDELLMNFRSLFNLRKSELLDLNLWERFMDIFCNIYGYSFIPDQVSWSFSELYENKDGLFCDQKELKIQDLEISLN